MDSDLAEPISLVLEFDYDSGQLSSLYLLIEGIGHNMLKVHESMIVPIVSLKMQ